MALLSPLRENGPARNVHAIAFAARSRNINIRQLEEGKQLGVGVVVTRKHVSVQDETVGKGKIRIVEDSSHPLGSADT